MTSSAGIEPRPHWWETSALTTVPSLLLYTNHTYSLLQVLRFSEIIGKDEAYKIIVSATAGLMSLFLPLGNFVCSA